jgi:hypothetical protein
MTNLSVSSEIGVSAINHLKKYGLAYFVLYLLWTYIRVKFFSSISKYPGPVSLSGPHYCFRNRHTESGI